MNNRLVLLPDVNYFLSRFNDAFRIDRPVSKIKIKIQINNNKQNKNRSFEWKFVNFSPQIYDNYRQIMPLSDVKNYICIPTTAYYLSLKNGYTLNGILMLVTYNSRWICLYGILKIINICIISCSLFRYMQIIVKEDDYNYLQTILQ